MSAGHRSQRIQEVRRQENELARTQSTAYQTARIEAEKAARQQELKKVHDEKLRLIEHLSQQREMMLAKMGQAHKAAEEQRLVTMEAEAQKKEKFSKFQAEAAIRGAAALQKEIEASAQREYTANALHEIRRTVVAEEAAKAHSNAAVFRVKQEAEQKEREEEEQARYIPPGGLVIEGPIDYTRTHFHNPVIVKHTLEQDISGLEKARQAEQDAYDRLQIQETTSQFQNSKAKERGDKAQSIEMLKSEYNQLETELKALHTADGMYKKMLGVYDPVCYNRTLVKDSQDENKRQQKLEKAFENILGLAPSSQSTIEELTPQAPVLTIPTVQPLTEDSRYGETSERSSEQTRIILKEGNFSPAFEPSIEKESSRPTKNAPRFASSTFHGETLKPTYSHEAEVAIPPPKPILSQTNSVQETTQRDLTDSEDSVSFGSPSQTNTPSKYSQALTSSPDTNVASFDPKNYPELESYEASTSPRKFDYYSRSRSVDEESPLSSSTSEDEEEFSEMSLSSGSFMLKSSIDENSVGGLLESHPAHSLAQYEGLVQETPNFAQKSEREDIVPEFNLYAIAKSSIIPEESESSSESSDEEYKTQPLRSDSSIDIGITRKPYSVVFDIPLTQDSELIVSSSSESDSEEETYTLPPVADKSSSSDMHEVPAMSTSDLNVSDDPSLANAFAKKRAEMMKKFGSREKSTKLPTPAAEKTKEELLAIRKQMVKPKTAPLKPVYTQKDQTINRLIKGERSDVDKRNMKSLTTKNYSQLPEVVRKREEESKRDESRQRRERVKEYERMRRSKRT